MTPELLKTSFRNFFSESSFFAANRITESAWIQHTPFAFWLVEQLKPKLLVELGVHTGMSYFAFCQSVKANNLITQCYGIDTWQGDEHSGLYSEEIWLSVNGYNTNEYAPFSTLLRTSFNEALPYFEAKSIDLLHIDGYHTYEAVKEDFENWLPKIANEGIVLFHDILVREREFGVYKLWTELKEKYQTFEFLHGHGLGVLTLGKPQYEVLKALFELTDEAEISKIRATYAELGNRLSDKLRIQHLEREIRQANAQRQHSSMQLEHARHEHAQLREQHENLEAQLKHAFLEYEHLKAKSEQASKDLEHLKAQYDFAKLEYEQLKNELEISKLNHEQSEYRVEELKKDCEQSKNAYEYLKAQYNYAKLEYEELVVRSRKLEMELEQEKQKSNNNIKKQQAELSNIMQELTKEKARAEQLNANLQEQQQKIEWYKEKYEEKRLLEIIKDRLLSR